MNIALVDYGAGNLTSVRKGLVAAGADVTIARSAAVLYDADGIVVPGVGHFAATSALGEDWRGAIARRVSDGVPLLGICLGMQWLFSGSDEAPGAPGLGVFEGRCSRLEAPRPLKVPHVGWNALQVQRPGGLLDGVANGAHVYFTHSYAAPVGDGCSATAAHGSAFAAVVQRGHVAGVQFHPEKSSAAGLRILHNFVSMVRG